MQLVLDKRGLSISVKNGMFCIRKSEDELQKIPVSQITSIIINKSISITSDVMFLAIENQIEIILIDRIGRPAGRVWSHKFGSISDIRRNQLEFSKSVESVLWIKMIMKRKLSNQEVILLSLNNLDYSTIKFIEKSCKRINVYSQKIENFSARSITEIAQKLRGWEGASSRIYFDVINKHLPEEYRFERRSQFPACDIFNSLLNYSYGILYSRVEGALIMAGIDPYVGIFHRDEYNKPSLVYDVIEKYRVWADFVVIDICMQQIMFKEFFIFEQFSCFLDSPAKRILIQCFNDYMEEVVKIEGVSRSRNNQIQIDAQKLATIFKNFK